MTAPITRESAIAKMDAGIPLAAGEVAIILGFNPKTISRWARAGVLPATRMGYGHRRWDPAVVAEFLKDFRR